MEIYRGQMLAGQLVFPKFVLGKIIKKRHDIGGSVINTETFCVVYDFCQWAKINLHGVYCVQFCALGQTVFLGGPSPSNWGLLFAGFSSFSKRG